MVRFEPWACGGRRRSERRAARAQCDNVSLRDVVRRRARRGGIDCREIQPEADKIISYLTPEPFFRVGKFF